MAQPVVSVDYCIPLQAPSDLGGWFEAYDQLNTTGTDRFAMVTHYDSFVEFAGLCDILLSELKQASQPKQHSSVERQSPSI